MTTHIVVDWWVVATLQWLRQRQISLTETDLPLSRLLFTANCRCLWDPRVPRCSSVLSPATISRLRFWGYSYLCICICEYVFVNLYNVYVYLYFCLTPVCVYMLTVRSRNNISVAVLGTRQPPLHHKDKCFVSTAAAKVARKIISEIQLRSYEIWSKGTSGIKSVLFSCKLLWGETFSFLLPSPPAQGLIVF